MKRYRKPARSARYASASGTGSVGVPTKALSIRRRLEPRCCKMSGCVRNKEIKTHDSVQQEHDNDKTKLEHHSLGLLSTV